MASIDPISNSIRMTLNPVMDDGKAVEKNVSISKLYNEVTAEKIDTVVTARESLHEYQVIETTQ